MRLQGMSPPPTPPPSPTRRRRPRRPRRRRRPRHPIAITADQGKAIALIAQRQFCDSVYMHQRRGALLAPRLGDDDRLRAGRRLLAAAAAAAARGAGLARRRRRPRRRARGCRRRRTRASSSRTRGGHAVHLLLGRRRDRPGHRKSTETGQRHGARERGQRHARGRASDITWHLDQAPVGRVLRRRSSTGRGCCRAARATSRSGASTARATAARREENTRAPWIEIDLRDGKPTDRDYYFFALYVTLPPSPSTAASSSSRRRASPRIAAT